MSFKAKMVDSPGLEEIRRLFLAVKFSERDVDNVRKRLKNSDIRKIEGKPIKGFRQGISVQDYLEHLEVLRREISLEEQNVRNLLKILEVDKLNPAEAEPTAAAVTGKSFIHTVSSLPSNPIQLNVRMSDRIAINAIGG